MRRVKKSSFILAVDLGGTKIATAVVTTEGKILARRYNPTPAHNGPKIVISSMLTTMEETISLCRIEAEQLSGIGIGAAGIIDSENGKVVFSPNLRGWREVPLRDIVQQHFGIPTYLGNDATLAALGEWSFGLGKKVSNLIYITVSTGIGGGIIADGRLYIGASGVAGEIGHMTIDINGQRCKCGNIGCWETLASGTALAEEAIRRIAQGEQTSIIGLVGGDISQIDAKIIFKAAERGDKLAQELIARLGFYLGVGLVNLINIFNPELILIGGGVAKMGDLLLRPAMKVVKERAFETGVKAVDIKPALLGDDSSLFGAAALILKYIGK